MFFGRAYRRGDGVGSELMGGYYRYYFLVHNNVFLEFYNRWIKWFWDEDNISESNTLIVC